MFFEGMQLGNYRLRTLIGRGATGIVYLADDLRLPRQVALKIVQAEGSSDEALAEATKLFQREARAISRLNHPNILPLFDFGEEVIHGTPISYLVSPFCMDGSLSVWVRQRTGSMRIEPHLVAGILQQAASGLGYAHNLHVIHRDVKPANFLVRNRSDTPERPDIMLADFGIAYIAEATAKASKTVRGTPVYMAPEQWSGDAVPGSDQYALGVMTYELLTGRPPFSGTQNQIMYHHLITFPQAPSSVNPQVPAVFDEVVLRALAKQPEARYPSVVEFAQAFHRALARTQHTVPLVQPRPAGIPVIRPTQVTPLPPTAIPVPDTPRHISQPEIVRSPSGSETPAIGALPKPGAPFNRHRIMLIGLVALLIISGIAGVFTFGGNMLTTYNSAATATAGAATIQAMQHNAATITAQNNATATQGAQATATAIFITDPYDYGYYANLVLYGPLTSNMSAQWDEKSKTCVFATDGYHVISSTGVAQSCGYRGKQFAGMAFQMSMNILHGNGGGLLFYDANGSAYYFNVHQDKTYALFACTSDGASCTNPMKSGYSSLITSGQNQVNTLAVVVYGQSIYLYINLGYVDGVDNVKSLPQNGLVGGVADAQSEVVFGDLKIWTS